MVTWRHGGCTVVVQMTWTDIEAAWPQLSRQAAAKWKKLSDADLSFVSGNRNRLIGKLEERYGVDDGAPHVDEWSGFEARLAQQ